LGAPTGGQRIRFTPLSPEEFAGILAEARAQRTEEDIAEYSRKKAAA
jgi:hypothetical protein